MANDKNDYPLNVFNFHISFEESGGGNSQALCNGAFSECTGLDATMEPKVINEGGRNYGPIQRVGPVTFSTVILRRGMTSSMDLWRWFDFVTRQNKSAYRLDVTIDMKDLVQQKTIITWKLKNALATKFKVPDLNAISGEVGIEELHLVHEGLEMIKPEIEDSSNSQGATNGG